MSKKVKLTKAQANAIESFINFTGCNEDAVIDRHCVLQKNKSLWEEKWEALNGVKASDLAKALYVGYEVDQTPEEELVLLYNIHDVLHQRTIYTTLKILGIQIEGINK